MAKEIATANAPAAVGPYSQALAVGPFVFASGQIPLNPSTGTIVGETAAEQAEQVFTNIEAVLKEAGLGIAMGNSPEALKLAADQVTLSNEKDGVYFALQGLSFKTGKRRV